MGLRMERTPTPLPRRAQELAGCRRQSCQLGMDDGQAGRGREEGGEGEHRSSRVGGHGLGQGPVRTAHEEEANGRYAGILLMQQQGNPFVAMCRTRGQRLLVCQDDDIRSPPNGQLTPPS